MSFLATLLLPRLLIIFALLPPLFSLSTCSIFYTFKSSVLWRFCSRFKKQPYTWAYPSQATRRMSVALSPHLPTRYFHSSFLFWGAAQMSTKVQIKSNVEIIARASLDHAEHSLFMCVGGCVCVGDRYVCVRLTACACVPNVLVIWLVAPA